MPGQAGTRRAALHQLISDGMVIIADGVDLRCGGILPAEAEGAHAALHGADDMPHLVRDARGAEIAIANRALRIRPRALLRLPASGNHETRRCARSRPHKGERIERRLAGWIDLRA